MKELKVIYSIIQINEKEVEFIFDYDSSSELIRMDKEKFIKLFGVFDDKTLIFFEIDKQITGKK